jgi:hypothetical protein
VSDPQPIPAPVEAQPEAQPTDGPPPHHWFHKVSAVLFIIFCLELGLFLLIYPWTMEWDTNRFATILILKFPRWNEYWQNAYVRGAVSGLGLIDLYISIGEIFRLRRFSQR